MPNSESSSTLRLELERAIRAGRCAYCRRPASPDAPLTREHVIPRAKGGSRKDVRIIVPACARCNHRRGCRELVLFLLTRPRRISAFLDYLSDLSPESVRQMDVRVFAELYAAVWMLRESARAGAAWREQLKRLCSGRTLHRRRYAARRVVGAVNGRLESRRERGDLAVGPTCLLPLSATPGPGPLLEEPLERIDARLFGLLALAWQVSAEELRLELTRQHDRSVEAELPVADEETEAEMDGADVVSLDGWRSRPRRRRLRVDRRGGRASRRPRGRQPRGRAA